MKKSILLLGIFLTLIFIPVIFAQMPVTVPVTDPGADRIGVVAAAKGHVELKLPGQVGRVAQSGQAVFLGDEVKTDAQGNLQILLLDETVFTIGPNSSLVIDEFVYDPKTQDGKVKANIAKGVFRYVSGKIAAKKPSNVTLQLPNATIGIRGTIVAGNAIPGGNSLAALLGPGLNNNAGATPGSFLIIGSGQSSGETVNRTGFGVWIGPNGTLSGVFQLTAADINNLTTGLSPSNGGNSGQGSGSATDQSGQGTVNTGGSVEGSNCIAILQTNTQNLVKNETIDDTSSAGYVTDGITTVAQLANIQTGVYHFFGSGNFVQTMTNGITSAYVGVVKTSIDINFGTRMIGGGIPILILIQRVVGGISAQEGSMSVQYHLIVVPVLMLFIHLR